MIVILVLIGKTATGKSRIKDELIKLGMDNVVTTTTRPMRDGEVQDVSYHFIDKSQFRQFKEQGFFAETTSYNTVHGTWYYGTQLKDLENNENKVIILNPDGIKSISEKIDMRKWLVVYITCPENIMKVRLHKRGDNVDEVARRIEADRKDFRNINRFVDVEIENNGSKTPEQIAHIIKSLYDRHLKENK